MGVKGGRQAQANNSSSGSSSNVNRDLRSIKRYILAEIVQVVMEYEEGGLMDEDLEERKFDKRILANNVGRIRWYVAGKRREWAMKVSRIIMIIII